MDGAVTRHKILAIAPTSFFADYGCHVRILGQIRALQELGYHITLCTYYNGRDVPGFHIVRTPPIPWRRGTEVGSSWHKIAFDALLLPRTWTTGRRLRPDLIHAYLHEGAFIGYLLSHQWKVPLIFDFQGSLTAEMIDHGFLHPESPAYPILRWLERWIDHQADAILVSSRHAARLLQEEFGCHPNRIHIVPDCVDGRQFRPRQPEDEADIAALKTELHIPIGRRVIVYLGLLAEYQGTGLLLQAARHLLNWRDDVHFLIMGFPHLERYQAQAEELGLRGHVTFTGAVPYQDAPRYLRLGDVAVAPKLSATEGSGKLLNYMALALPTVTFDTPVNREYLDQSGVYARAGNALSLAEMLNLTLDNWDQARKQGEQLRQKAIQSYSWESAARKISEVYSLWR